MHKKGTFSLRIALMNANFRAYYFLSQLSLGIFEPFFIVANVTDLHQIGVAMTCDCDSLRKFI
jgi:hypothetical protein